MLERFLTWLVDTIGALGYPGIAVLMAIESSVIPLPSEMVMPPAGYLVAMGRMNAALALGACILGGLLGSYANYWIASRVGRWFFVRYGRWVLVSERSLERSERFFQKHGPIAVFISRLFPVLRHLVSIPAGIARMPVGRFLVYTGAGAGLWGGILMAIGWVIGKEGRALSREQIATYSHRAVMILIPAVAVLIAAYVIRHRRRIRAERGAGVGAGTGQGEGSAAGGQA
ncbi:MAG TPA: DedA family protein [Gemmatimonadales bacterium]|nr:DedA family protein [Gemmatimonadales bacterium]